MKTFEKILWGAGAAGLIAGTALSIGNDDPTQVFDRSRPATVVEVVPQTQGPGSYIDGAFSEDPVIPAHLQLEQCPPDQNPVLHNCVIEYVNIPQDAFGNFVAGQEVTVEELALDN